MSAKVAVITGASSGIGEAVAKRLAAEGFELVLGARRLERLQAVAKPIGARALPLDVTDTASVAAFAAGVDHCSLLVNNAGGALGLDPVAEADEEQWRWMYEANVLGVMRMTRALLPAIETSGDGHVMLVGSIAGVEVYPGGGGYTAAKHGASAVARTLRLELVGKPVRVTEVAPGLVDTEFSTVRFGGDAERAARVYEGMQPLSADDVADVVAFAATRPPHVNLDYVTIKPRAQATATLVHRE